MFKKLLDTNEEDGAALTARLALGIVILRHGMQKLLGLFGGNSFSATVDFFTGIGVPAFISVLKILVESFGSLFLVPGLISGLSAAGIALIMLGAVFLVHLPNGFFMNWFGTQKGEGYEYYILALGLALIVVLRCGGKWSLDGIIGGKAVGPEFCRVHKPVEAMGLASYLCGSEGEEERRGEGNIRKSLSSS